MNANLKAVSDCFTDKNLLKCLVVKDNVKNVNLMTSLIYVTLLIVAIFIRSVFWSHCLTGTTETIEKLNKFAQM